jgi:hypothetical protein
MRIQTILNRVEKFKSFIYGQAHLEERDGGPALVVWVRPRKNARPFCSGCGRPGRAYDHLEQRHFEFVPVWVLLQPAHAPLDDVATPIVLYWFSVKWRIEAAL